MLRLSAGCVMCTLWAAVVKFSVSAAAMKHSNSKLVFMETPSPRLQAPSGGQAGRGRGAARSGSGFFLKFSIYILSYGPIEGKGNIGADGAVRPDMTRRE